ncbi:MAG: DUF4199 domain-containing protein [Flavobacteriales bacterium]
MLKNPFQVAITFSIVALIIKLVIFSLNMQHGEMENYIRYIYMLLLLVTIFFGMRSNKIAEGNNTSFIQDFKAGARTAAFFAVIVAVITYVYYAKIDANFFVLMQNEKIAILNEKITEMIQAGTSSKDVLVETYFNQLFGIKTMLSAYFQAMWTMFGLVFMGLFNALVFALLMKKMPGFRM